MIRRFCFIGVLLVLVTISLSAATEPPPKPIPPEAANPRLETVLQLLAERRQESLAAAQAFAQAKGIELSDDAVRVIIEPVGGSSAEIDRTALEALGGVVEATSRSLMRARIPLLQLIPVANTVQGISFIRRPYRPRPVAVTSEGVTLTGADDYHSFGYYGQGAKVAVIDLGFSGLTAAIANGEFGSGSGYGGSAVIDSTCTKDYTGTGLEAGTSHGTGVAEVVHDMAPQATLCLMKIGDSLDLENAKNDALTYGVQVVNHSVAWFNTNFYDGTGTIADIAADARNNGILWVNAAGNEADSYYNGHWQGSFVDSDGDGYLDFGSGSDPIDGDSIDECNGFYASGGEIINIYLTWDAWPSDPQDYDLYLYLSSPTPVDSSTRVQNGSEPPTEDIYYPVSSAGTYCFAIYAYDAPSQPDLEAYIFKDNQTTAHNQEYHQAASSIPAPANDDKVLSVGAIYQGNWTTGPQESFSSQGPTNDSKWDNPRTKPDIMGPDGVTNYTYTGGFYGTSAAAPHVAGAAALLLSEDPSRTADDLQTKLEADAIDMGAAGKDNVYGSGRLNLIPQAPGTEAVFRVTQGGDVYADRAYFCGLSSGCFNSGSGADIAEAIRVSEPVTPGDLVELDPQRPGYYRKARGPYSRLAAGVVSTRPGITMGKAERRPLRALRINLSLSAVNHLSAELSMGMSLGSLGGNPPPQITLQWTVGGVLAQLELDEPLLALIGVVPVKATAENGPIRPGDLLVSSSTPGYVMRCGIPAECKGAIVGKALEPLEEGTGMIEMLVMR